MKKEIDNRIRFSEMKLSLEERTFADGSIISTPEESYENGFKSGLFWPDSWDHRPGGPSVYTCNKYDDKRLQTLALASSEAHRSWLKGWDDGNFSKQMLRKMGINLPSWTDTNEFRKAVD